MRRWFDHVSDGRSPQVERIASAWFDQDADVSTGRASSNFVCRVGHDGRLFYLRCNYESERSAKLYGAEMRFVRHLQQQGFPVCAPISSRNGGVVETVSTDLGRFNAVMLEAAPGSSVGLEDLDESMLRTWGATMARMHRAAEGYDAFDRPSWQDHIAFAEVMIPVEEHAAHVELAAVGARLERVSPAEDLGLIHFDLEPDNMSWLEGKPWIFDFDDCARYPLVADIAFALRELYDDRIERLDLSDSRWLAFLSGYRSVRDLPDRSLELLPVLIRAHNLYWFARLHRATAEAAPPDEPEWAHRLRLRLLDVVDTYRLGFESQSITRL